MPTTRAALTCRSLSSAVMLTVLLAPAVRGQQHEHGPAHEKVGSVVFPVSCNAAAQPLFNRAVALLHSFEFGRSLEAFNATLQADPSCAMAEWGIALSRWGNPFSASLRATAPLQQGRDAVGRGTALGARSDRELAYLQAIGQLYAAFETVDQRARIVAYRQRDGRRRRGKPERHRGVDFLRAGRRRGRAAERQDLCGTAEGRHAA